MIRLIATLLRNIGRARGQDLLKVFVLTLVICAYSSSGFMFFELSEKPDLTWGDAIWWSVVTMTTVGYGDFFPSSLAGRLFVGFPTMIFGIGVLGYLVSQVASYLLEARSNELRGLAVNIMEDHILIVHCPQPSRVAAMVDELRHDSATRDSGIILIDDELDELPEELRQLDVSFVRGDPTKEAVLDRASFRQARIALILAKDPADADSDNASLAAALTLEHLHPEVQSVAECVDPEKIELMRKAGCDSVVCIADLATNMLVHQALDPGTQAVVRELTTGVSGAGTQLYIVNIVDPAGQRYETLARRVSDDGGLAIGIQREGKAVLNPESSATLIEGDDVVCLASKRPAAIRLG